MEITLEYLNYQLKSAGYRKIELRKHINFTFTSYFFWDGAFTEQKCIYLISTKKTNMVSPILASRYPFLIYSDTNEEEIDLSMFSNALILRKSPDIAPLINLLNLIFSSFSEWKLLLESHDPEYIDPLFRLTWNIFHIPVVLIDSYFNTVAIADNNSSNYRRRILSNPKAVQLNEDIFLQDDYQDSILKNDVFVQQDKIFGQFLLNKNIRTPRDLYFRLTAEIPDSNVDSLIYQLFEYMGQHLQETLTQYDIQNIELKHPQKNQAFYDCIRSLLNGEKPENYSPLIQHGWEINHQYSVNVFEPIDDFLTGASLEYPMKIIADFCYDCICCLDSEKYIICIRNMTLEEKDRDDFHTGLVYILREYLLKAGFSCIFSGLQNLSLYKRQAFEALSIGKKTDPTYWYYPFEKYQLQHLLSSSPYPYEDICSKYLPVLKDIDKEKGTELYQTLKKYLYNNCDAQKTSEQLFIHRTTLLYRIKKISTLIGMKLEDPDTYLHLLISFRIMDMTENNLSNP